MPGKAAEDWVRFESTDGSIFGEIRDKLLAGLRSNGKAVSLDDMRFNGDDEISLSEFIKSFERIVTEKYKEKLNGDDIVSGGNRENALPRVITFPYSRHSSYSELCHLVKALNPKDVYPCTVDEKNWHRGLSLLKA